ncbi:MAG TPA: ATP-binding protein [Nocardioidaceae bacterium]|jgi:signal transduction histidine kinase|nr:ATP-binding protein [Nocardioidaceae bacterium]
MRRLSTVRSKVTLLATVLVVVMLAVSAVALVTTQRGVLTHGIDESLAQRADNIEPSIVAGTFGARLPNEGDPEDAFLQVLAPDGSVLAASENAAGLPAVIDPVRPGEDQVTRTVTDIPISNHEFRVLARPLRGSGEQGTLVVAKNLDDVNESAETLTRSLALAIPVVTVLLASLLWWLTGRVLRPVEAMRAEVASIEGHELHRRVPAGEADDEISRLARTMNAMLDRVEHATERQRSFVADASHELRSPLTRLRSSLEVAQTQPEATSTDELVRGLLADTTDLQTLVDDLLFLARSESGAFTLSPKPVDLDDIVLEEAGALRDRGRVGVDVAGVSAARTRGDAHQLARAVRNLASNAERHAASRVVFSLREVGDRCELVIADDGPGIAPEHRDLVFERFTRLDEARSRDAGGAGLGLAIVRDIVDRHGGTVTIGSAVPTGARFVVDLPRVE